MLSYRAPKSQMWGHRLSRLSAVDLLDRAELFLRERTIAKQPATAEFLVVWTPRRSPAISESIEVVRRVLASQPTTHDCTNKYYEPARNLSWTLGPDQVRPAALWLEQMYAEHGEDDFSANLSSTIIFEWNDLANDGSPRHGGMFGFHLARPRGVTTMFGFPSMEHYQGIKEYLVRIGLVVLSDKHLREVKPLRRRGR